MSVIKQVRNAVVGIADTVGRNKAGRVVVRRGYFYRNGATDEKFARAVRSALAAHGIMVRVVEHGDVWKPFRGSASVANSSHWYVELEIAGE